MVACSAKTAPESVSTERCRVVSSRSSIVRITVLLRIRLSITSGQSVSACSEYITVRERESRFGVRTCGRFSGLRAGSASSYRFVRSSNVPKRDVVMRGE